MNARDTRSRQELRETSFAGCCAQRNAVEQDLITRRSEQQAAAAAFVQSTTQFFPGGLKLRSRAHVPELIEARKFQ
jgi:hypothetical protein